MKFCKGAFDGGDTITLGIFFSEDGIADHNAFALSKKVQRGKCYYINDIAMYEYRGEVFDDVAMNDYQWYKCSKESMRAKWNYYINEGFERTN